jgi:hypothetical protein
MKGMESAGICQSLCMLLPVRFAVRTRPSGARGVHVAVRQFGLGILPNPTLCY